jgi:hypothetical protein
MIIVDELIDTENGRLTIMTARSFYPSIPVVYWASGPAFSKNIIDMDPDVILACSEGDEALLKIISILRGTSIGRD